MSESKASAASTGPGGPESGGNPFDQVVARLKDVRPTSKGVRAKCPAHDDHTPSLDVDRGEGGKVLIKCRSAGCTTEAIVAAIGLTVADLFSARPERPWAKEPKSAKSQKTPTRHPDLAKAAKAAQWSATDRGKITPSKVTRHDYTDQEGTVVGGVFRFDFADGRPKELRRFRRDGDAWILKDIEAPRPLYHLHGLVKASVDEPVLFVEGEKCANAVFELGMLGTTSAGGANQPLSKTDFGPLANRHVVILPDNDDSGRTYAAGIAAQAHKAGAATVRRLELPGLADREDIYDWAERKRQAGLSDEQIFQELRTLVAAAKHVPAPEQDADEPAGEDQQPGNKPDGECVPLGERDPNTGKLVLSDKKTLPTARAFLRDFHTVDRYLTLVDYGGSLWTWRGNRFVEVEEASLLNRLQPWLHDALRPIVIDDDEFELTRISHQEESSDRRFHA